MFLIFAGRIAFILSVPLDFTVTEPKKKLTKEEAEALGLK